MEGVKGEGGGWEKVTVCVQGSNAVNLHPTISSCIHALSLDTHTHTKKRSLITDYAQQTAASGCVSVCLRK